MAHRIIDAIGRLPGAVLYLVAAGLAFGETALFLDLIVPGEAGMVVTGAAAREAGLSLPLLIAAGTLGAVLGDSVSYLIGRRFGRSLVHRWGPTRRHLEPGFDRAERFFDAHGGRAVFAGRWVGALRAVVPAVAGTSRMAYPRFMIWNVLASVSWAGTMLALGYFLGRRVADVIDRLGLVVSVVAVTGLVVWWLVGRIRRRGRPDTGEADRAGRTHE